MLLFGTSGPSRSIAPCTLTRQGADFDGIRSRFRAPGGALIIQALR